MASHAISSALWFVLILASIPVVLWLIKRSPGSRFGGTPAAGAARVVATLPLSPSQRIVTLEVGTGESRRWLVVGVTPQSMTTLHEMPPQADAPVAGAVAPPFAQLLGSLRRNPGDRP